MRFTIVTPVLNGLRWLPECVASVDAQRADDGVDVEHIVLDPGSTDGTREWLAINANRATLVFERDGGQTDALARGFARARGDVLGWLNADDAFEPHALARVASALEKNAGASGAVGSMIFVDTDGSIAGINTPPLDCSFRGILHHPRALPQPAVLFTREAYERSGGFDVSLDLAMDVDLWLKLTAIAPMISLREVLARFRLHENAKSVKRGAAAAREDFAIRRRSGLSLATPAAASLVRYGWVQPALRPAWRRLVKPAVRFLGAAIGDGAPRRTG
jgi:glycosyltransferase involved in cell wall biosynthesis